MKDSAITLVCVADTHLYHDDLGALPEGDVLVHAGDFLQSGTLDELERFVDWLARQPHGEKVLVAGNHDRCFEEHPAESRALVREVAHYLQDSDVVVAGLRFWGSPWQPAFGGWAFNLARGAALAERWSHIPTAVDVLVTHGPPAGFGDQTSVAGRQGCTDLRRALERASPRLHLFGHIHQDGGLWTMGSSTLVNCTTWESERAPTVLRLPTERGAVQVLAVPEREAMRT